MSYGVIYDLSVDWEIINIQARSQQLSKCSVILHLGAFKSYSNDAAFFEHLMT